MTSLRDSQILRTISLLIAVCFAGVPAHAKYSGGSGTADDPYQIATADDLMLLGETPEDYDKHFIMTADIDLDPNLLGGKVFDTAVIAPDTNDTDSGFQGIPFTGALDGNGHVISHLTIAGENYLGLFGKLGWGSSVSNIGLEAAEVDGVGDHVGGLLGYHSQGNITTCHSNGTVAGAYYVGGLVGRTDRGSVATSYSTGAVSGESRVGGLVGLNYNCSVDGCYSNSSVNGDTYYIGGLVGRNNGSITASYSSGQVRGEFTVGGLVGWNDTSITSCFWDTQTSGQTTSAGGTGKTTAEMQTGATFLEAGWDFVGESENGTEDIWAICEGTNYPRFVRQIPVGDFVCPDGVVMPDLALLATHWLDDDCDASNDYCEGTDLDKSGKVDFADFVQFAENWLAGVKSD